MDVRAPETVTLRGRARRLAGRVQASPPIRVLAAYGESRASNYALALAFAGFVSMFPLILGALSIIGLAIRDQETGARFQSLVLQLFPATAQPELLQGLGAVKKSAGWLGLVSIAGLVWSASSIFATLEFALSQIFGTKQRDVLRQRLMGLVMMVVLVVAIVLTVAVNGVAALFPFAWVTSILVGAAVMVALLVALYRFVPNRTYGGRSLLPGALLAGVLIELLSLGFPLYASLAHSFNTYGAQFALFLLLATWFYLLSQLILLGAVFNRFRLGEPRIRGLFASGLRESQATPKPVEAIEREKAATAR